jgi:hypothetical protein
MKMISLTLLCVTAVAAANAENRAVAPSWVARKSALEAVNVVAQLEGLSCIQTEAVLCSLTTNYQQCTGCLQNNSASVMAAGCRASDTKAFCEGMFGQTCQAKLQAVIPFQKNSPITNSSQCHDAAARNSKVSHGAQCDPTDYHGTGHHYVHHSHVSRDCVDFGFGTQILL